MDFKQTNVLITGGSEGIGLGLASRFVNAGCRVLITGRNKEKLLAAKQKNPRLEIFVNDIGIPTQREILAKHIRECMPDINVVINNAGIQRRIALAVDNSPWADRQKEIDILFSAPVHLNALLIPIILNRNMPAIIVNITSGGAYIPQTFAPLYSACKAALHSYSMTLRIALSDTTCRVVEVVPPAVQTNLSGSDLNHGVPLNDFCDSIFEKLTCSEETQIGFGPTNNLIQQINGRSLDEILKENKLRFPLVNYSSNQSINTHQP